MPALRHTKAAFNEFIKNSSRNLEICLVGV